MAEPPKVRKPEAPYVYLPQIGQGYVNGKAHPLGDGHHMSGQFFPMYDWNALVNTTGLEVFRRRYPNDDVYKAGYAKGQE